MALPELAIMQRTFELLQPLDPHARRRVLTWVEAALDGAGPQPAAAETGAQGPDEPDGTRDPGEATPAVEALAPAEPDAPTRAADVAEPDSPVRAADVAEPDSPVRAADVAAGTGDTPAQSRGARRTRQPRAPKAVPSPAPRKVAKRAAAADTAVATPPANGRRGRPPADEIMRVYQDVGGKLTELANHYGKPYTTVQGWASALRREGFQIGRSRSA